MMMVIRRREDVDRVWIRCKMTELPEIKNPLIFGSGDGLWFPAGDALGFNLKMCAVAPC